MIAPGGGAGSRVALLILLAWAQTFSVTTVAYGANRTEIQQGRYLAITGDCAACHTAPGGKTFAGGLPIATPIGTVISTNITPSRTAGIGGYTLRQFSDALRKGIRRDGKHLYPAMPYVEYALLTNDDVRALYAYFMNGVPPIDSTPPRTRLPFPFDIRLLMAPWNWLYLDSKPYTSDPNHSAEWNRGAYLVRGLAHCGECHTPRNLLMAERQSRALAGATIDTWMAPNITSDTRSGIGNWTTAQIVDYLRRGVASGKAQAAGPMVTAIDLSLRHLKATDLSAIARYLKTVLPRHDAADTRAVDSWGSAYADLASIRGRPLPTDPGRMTGPQLYDAYCATCHEDRGQGSFDGSLPPLYRNTATGRANTHDLVMVVLDGIQWNTDGSGTRMPGFASELSDRQIATLGTYLTQHFGNPSAAVTATEVATLRAGVAAPSHLVLLARVLVAVILGILALIIAAIIRALLRRSRTAPTPPATH